MPTALDLITSAAVKLGAIESGEPLTAQEGTDSFNVLNSMLDFWAIDKLMVYQIVQNEHTWPAATASRTIGTGGNFNVIRPNRIEEGTYFRDGTTDYPVTIVRNREVYDSLPSKTDQGSFPEILFYDPAYPLGILYVYPVPSGSLSLFLNSWQVLQNFASLTTDLSLPLGYQWTIEHNLAVALEPVFDLTVPDSVLKEAKKSKAAIERLNDLPIVGSTDAAAALGGGRGRNIYTDR